MAQPAKRPWWGFVLTNWAFVVTTLMAWNPASAEMPDYVADAWRARLAGIAPVCGERDREWAARVATGQEAISDHAAPQTTVLFAQIPEPKARHEIKGALAMFVRVGEIAGSWGNDACKAVATRQGMKSADVIADSVQKANAASAVPMLPDYLAEDGEDIFFIRMAEECRVRPKSWTEAAFASVHADAIDQTYTARDKPNADLPMESYLMEEEGMVEAADYSASRIAMLFPRACHVITGAPQLKSADTVRLRYHQDPSLFAKHLRTPDD